MMPRDNFVSPKIHQLESKSKNLTLILGVSGLCIFFYILGSWNNIISSVPNASIPSIVPTSKAEGNTASSISSSSWEEDLDYGAHHQDDDINVTWAGNNKFPPCDMKYFEYTPCQDRPRGRKFPSEMLRY